jgi:hypothetical protein
MKIISSVSIGQINPTEKLEVYGNIFLSTDSDKLIFGAAKDASIGYDGTNLVVTPDVVGTGNLIVNGNEQINNSLNVLEDIDANYVYAKNQVMQVHQPSDVVASAIDTWYDLAWDLEIDGETNKGWYDVNALDNNESITITNFEGILRVQGCLHPKNDGVGNRDATIYVRVLFDDVEARCLQASMTKGFKEDGVDILPYVGTSPVEEGTIIRVQWRTTDVDLILSGSAVFDTPVSASVNFERISDLP